MARVRRREVTAPEPEVAAEAEPEQDAVDTPRLSHARTPEPAAEAEPEERGGGTYTPFYATGLTKVFAIAGRELGGLFVSPIGWVITPIVMMTKGTRPKTPYAIATRSVPFDAVPEVEPGGRSISELLGDLLADLRRRGFGQVFRHRFRVDLSGLHVVKVVVPRCEELDVPVRRMGARLFERVDERQEIGLARGLMRAAGAERDARSLAHVAF